MNIRSLVAVGLMSSVVSAHAVTTVLSDYTWRPFPAGTPAIAQQDIADHFLTTTKINPQAPFAQDVYLGAGGFSALHGTNSFIAYCVEINIPVDIPGTYGDGVYSLVDATTGFGTRATDLRKLITWANAAHLPNNAATSAAMQAAVWEIVHETAAGPYSFTGGKLSTTSRSVVTQNALNAIDWNAIGQTTPTVMISRLESGTKQDLLVFAPVPEVGTLTMMLLAWPALGWSHNAVSKDRPKPVATSGSPGGPSKHAAKPPPGGFVVSGTLGNWHPTHPLSRPGQIAKPA